MCEAIGSLVQAARAMVATLGDATLPADRAVRVVSLASELERLAVAARTVAAARVVETRAWQGSGARSATEWFAARTGTTLTHAAQSLSTAAALEDLPETRAALLDGRLSSFQANQVAAAASADPAAERALVRLAAREPLAALRERCRDVIAAAVGDEDATERVRRSRYFRHWAEDGGGVRFDALLAPDDAAPLIAVVRARADELEREARASRHVEHQGAYAADALCSLVDGAGAPRTMVHVIVSKDAVERGNTVAGETCKIEGVGPISVGTATRLATKGPIRLIERDLTDVRRVSRATRTIPDRLKAALEVRDPVCVVPGCNRRRGLEIDHVLPFAAGGRTELANLARLCRFHHSEKTHHGWQLARGPGEWRWSRARAP